MTMRSPAGTVFRPGGSPDRRPARPGAEARRDSAQSDLFPGEPLRRPVLLRNVRLPTAVARGSRIRRVRHRRRVGRRDDGTAAHRHARGGGSAIRTGLLGRVRGREGRGSVADAGSRQRRVGGVCIRQSAHGARPRPAGDQGAHAAMIHTAGASQLGRMLIRLAQRHGFPLISIVRREALVAELKAAGAAQRPGQQPGRLPRIAHGSGP